jgi:hypothetical protein
MTFARDRFPIDSHLMHMMQMQPITRLGSTKADRFALPDGVSTTDLAIGQLLGMARSANFWFDISNGRLVVVASNGDWKTMKTIGRLMNEIGIEAIVDYFQRNPQDQRERLSAPAPVQARDH